MCSVFLNFANAFIKKKGKNQTRRGMEERERGEIPYRRVRVVRGSWGKKKIKRKKTHKTVS